MLLCNANRIIPHNSERNSDLISIIVGFLSLFQIHIQNYGAKQTHFDKKKKKKKLSLQFIQISIKD